MSDLKFSCPQCQQHIQCDENYGGLEIACPACNARMVVPGPARAPAPPPAVSGSACPGCGAVLAAGAVLCMQCGYNLRTGQRVQPQSASRPGVGRSKPARAPAGGDDNWFKTPYPYLALLVAVFAALYYFGRSNDAVMFVFLGLALLYLVTVQIIMLVHAFKDSIGVGFLALCIPIYGVYFVYRRSENPVLMALYGVSILLNLALYTLKGFE